MKIKFSRKTNIVLLSVFSTVIVLYALTFFFGIREVKIGHETELRKRYAETEAWYKTHPLSEIQTENPIWKKRFEKDKTFPTWEEFKKLDEKTCQIEYFVILPFLVKSNHNSIYVGYEEYHFWYVFGERFLRRNLLRIV